MIDFVEALLPCIYPETSLYYDLSKVQGYSESELEIIGKLWNIDITGQLRELLLQMGKCSGRVIWGYGIFSLWQL